jgi:fructose-specific component phosphotransferase system IIB-like protein
MYLFFIRAFNDIDHMTPIVWKMHQDNYPVALYCLNPGYDIAKDYHLTFLKQLGVKVDYLYYNFDKNLGLQHRILRFLIFASYAIYRYLERHNTSSYSKLLIIPQRLARHIAWNLYEYIREKFYDINWAKNILERSNAQVLCFDWIRPKQFVVHVLLKAAKEMSIPALALPHGVYIYTNDFITIESRPVERFKKLNRYDHVIVQNELHREVMAKSGLDSRKILIMGSARYCPEWMEQHKKILSRKITSNKGSSDKLKIVFMATKAEYRINIKRMLNTFKLLSQFEGIEVFIKPHTRTSKEDRNLLENLSLPNAADVSSVELCEWADIVLVIGSSIILEPLLQGKPVLYLKYLHGNITQYEDFKACWIIHDEDELRQALSVLKENKLNMPYSKENVDRFAFDIVYGGSKKRDVLKDYEQFIANYGSENV